MWNDRLGDKCAEKHAGKVIFAVRDMTEEVEVR